MGADLLVAALVIDKEKEPDFEAGRKWIDEALIEDLDGAYQDRHGEMRDRAEQDAEWDGDDYHFVTEDGEYTEAGEADLRKYYYDLLDRLDKEVINPEWSRGMALLEIRGRGSTSAAACPSATCPPRRPT